MTLSSIPVTPLFRCFHFSVWLLRKWTIWNGNGNGVLGFIVLVVLVLSQLVIRTGKSWWVIHFFEFLKCLKVKDSIFWLISFVSLNLISGKKTKEMKSEYKIKDSNVSFYNQFPLVQLPNWAIWFLICIRLCINCIIKFNMMIL